MVVDERIPVFGDSGGSDFRLYDLFRLKGLSFDGMVGAWCFSCLSGPPGFTCWISFAPVFSFITVESVSLLYLIVIS